MSETLENEIDEAKSSETINEETKENLSSTDISSQESTENIENTEIPEAEEITEIEVENNILSFEVEELGTYAVVEEDANAAAMALLNDVMLLADEPEYDAVTLIPITVPGGNVWDGSVATEFRIGEGTEEFPYLITTGAELAYLAQQVNSGTTFEGVYFQLANDINLNSLTWTPIGNLTNSFRGIFDGAGRTISNVSTVISSYVNNTVQVSGFFGSIGGGNTYSIVKNVEFNAVNVALNVNRSTAFANSNTGYKLGTVAGVMYNHSQITNVVVKNSTIIHDGQLRGTYQGSTHIAPIVFVGGLVGDAVNTSNSTTDPGNGARALIENCYSNVDISMNIRATSTNSNAIPCYSQTNIGGIIGRIMNQNIWPDNCFYTGDITSTNTSTYQYGMIGPIFGAEWSGRVYVEAGVTTTNKRTLMNEVWNGDNSDNLTMTSYYSNYSVYRTEFTSTLTTGTAANSTTYRRSTSTTAAGYTQGVNKGIYLSNQSSMLNNFNSNANATDAVWEYSDEFKLVDRISTEAIETADYSYEIVITDNYNTGTYTNKWYVNDVLDPENTGLTFDITATFERDNEVRVLTYDGSYYAITEFIVPKLSIEIAFNIDENNNLVIASLVGTALPYINLDDYTFQWYTTDPFMGNETIIEGETALILENLQQGVDYKLIATNNEVSILSTENTFTYGDRIVVFVDWNNGNDNNDGFTPETAVETLEEAYSKLSSNGSRDENIIVMMGRYADTSLDFYDSRTSATYRKNATITGLYMGVDYEAYWFFGGSSTFRYLNGETTFQYLEFYGRNNSMYLICQGYSVTFGEDVTMTGYTDANTNQGLLGNNAPAFHLFGGWYQYNERTLPRNNSKIVIKSGTFGRVILGSTPGTSSGIGQSTSHDFTGSSTSDMFNVEALIDIQNSTTASGYDYDINLLVGGAACGNTYSNVIENINSGTVGRVLGGSIGDSSNLQRNYPENTFLGSTVINISGGTIDELYGGCLGRNMGISDYWNSNTNVCESYFYGTIDINISGGTVKNNIYGAGAGGVTGYHANSSDTYKSYGQPFTTSVDINISGGNIEGNIFGGGYGYTEYLNQTVTAADGGALYGNSNIKILGSPTIEGNIYGAGCGYNYTNRQNLAQMYGNSVIDISGTPNIIGQVYGAGAGINGYANMAKLIGTSKINVASNLDVEVYGGGNIAPTEGNTNVYINAGTHTANIYGGGNLGIITGTSNVYINGGTSGDIYGGGNQAAVNATSNVYMNGGTASNVFGGGNQATVTNTNVTITNGTSPNIFGGGNEGTVTTSIVSVSGGNFDNVYGGGNKASVETTTVNMSGSTTGNVFGGGNEGEVTTSNVTATSGTFNNIYGGGNLAEVTTTNVNINGSTTTNIFGGGNEGEVTTSNVNVTEGDLETVYGGGNKASTQITTVQISGSTTTNVFGGGNEGEVTTSNVTVANGNLDNVYGGGNKAAAQDTNVIISGGISTNVFGGGNEGDATTTNIIFASGNATNVFGGGNQANAETTNVYLAGGNITDVFGGSNQTGNVTTSNITTVKDNVSSEEPKAEITYNSYDVSWESNEYEKVVDVVANYTNSTSEQIPKWKTILLLPDSAIHSNYSQSAVKTIGNNIIWDETNNYYGTNAISAGGTYTINQLKLLTNTNEEIIPKYVFISTTASGKNYIYSNLGNLNVSNIYGGNNAGGTTTNTNINTNTGTVNNIYGGGNQAVATNTSVIIDGGTVNNVYGGGNLAVVTNPYVEINSDVQQNVYGGGNAAGVNGDTSLNILGGTIGVNIYGGGNEGTVSGNTNVNIEKATILGSAYAGGNGVTAIVNGNANINVSNGATIGDDGCRAPARGSVFGGGNAAATGTEENNNSTSTVNIAGGTIYGNVYGGANTSVVYGVVNVNIGKEAINNDDLTISDIYIKGTIFGGGEANASGSETYDYSFISVTEGITINIDGTGYTKFGTNGSIFGSGNASSTEGDSFINIKNYGTVYNPQSNISIQRATVVTMDNSSIALSGATDRTNEYSNVNFSLSRIEELKIKNSSCLYLNYGANLLEKFSSLVDINGVETVAQVTIDEETGATTRNVDNRIYLLEGNNLNIATNEKATAYGNVVGMTFLGLFTSKTSPSTSTGFYNASFDNGEEITNVGTFLSNAYVKGAHKENHDITVDGFYTNKNNEGYIKTEYVGVTPEDDIYYLWLVGEKMDITVFNIEMTASKYATLGTTELPLDGFSTPNIEFILSGFASDLNPGISLVDEANINVIEEDETIANNTFGLSIKSGKSGWKTNNETKFYTANGGTYSGNNKYDSDNSNFTPSLLFSFFHSQNLTEAKQLGTVTIRYQVLTPIDDLSYKISYIDIIVTLATALFQDDFYEAAISPGEEFGLFTTTETNITDSGMFSVYYSLLMNNFSTTDYYEHYLDYNRALVSRDENQLAYVYPEKTTITMLDMANNQYYYYVVTSSDEATGKYSYDLNKFIRMGSTNELYDEIAASNLYYNEAQDLVYENFIFHVDFSQCDITADAIDNTLFIELQDENDQTLIGVLGINRGSVKYGIYTGKDATINLVSEISPDTIYLGETVNLSVKTDFTQKIVNSKTIYDTTYFNQKMGVKLTIFDSNGNQLNSDSLLGVIFKLDGINYYPRIDGTVRMKIADRVTNVLSKITIDTENNTTLATDTYTLKIETFGSADGIYYGVDSSAEQEVQFSVVNGAYGLKVTTSDNAKIIDKETGYTLENSNSLVSFISYSSVLESPKITVSLLRRNYDEPYSLEYDIVDLADYVSTSLTETTFENEYLVAENPIADITYFLNMKPNNKTGTYKLLFKLYDGSAYIGEAYEYFIIK